MDSCNRKPIVFHHDQHGYLSYCPGCHNFQLGFGNVYLVQSKDDLTYLAEIIGKMLRRNTHRKDRYLRNIHLDTPYEGFGLLLSVVDLERLDHMLQKTVLILQADDPVRHQ